MGEGSVDALGPRGKRQEEEQEGLPHVEIMALSDNKNVTRIRQTRAMKPLLLAAVLTGCAGWKPVTANHVPAPRGEGTRAQGALKGMLAGALAGGVVAGIGAFPGALIGATLGSASVREKTPEAKSAP